MRTLLLALCLSAQAADFYVTATASAGGTGTAASPWRIADVCAGTQPAAITTAVATETAYVWVRGGTYTGPIVCPVSGNATYRVVLVAYPGESPAISNAVDASAIKITGTYADLVGFEIYSTISNRRSAVGAGLMGDGVEIRGSYIRMMNNVIHDNGQCITSWGDSPGSEIIDNLCYNNGWESADRGRGHTHYLQNDVADAQQRVKGTFDFGGFSHGLHGYGESGFVHNWLIEKSLLTTAQQLMGGITAGGSGTAGDITIRNNVIWGPTDTHPNFQVGYTSTTQHLGPVTVGPGNYIIGGVQFNRYPSFTLTDNHIFPGNSADTMVWVTASVKPAAGPVTWAATLNDWFVQVASRNLLRTDNAGDITDNWRWAGGGGTSTWNPTYDAAGSITYGNNGWSTQPITMVVTNDYDPQRCSVFTAFSHLGPTSVNLASCGLNTNDPYEIMDGQAWSYGTLATGTYAGGNVSITRQSNYTAPTGTYTFCWNTACSSCSAADQVGCVTHAGHSTTKHAYVDGYIIRRRQLYYSFPFTIHNGHQSATQIKVDLSPSPTLALAHPSTTSSCAFGADCAFNVPTHMTGKMYYRYRWLNVSGGTVATSPIYPVTITP